MKRKEENKARDRKRLPWLHWCLTVVITASMLLTGVPPVSADTPETTITSGTNPAAVAVNPATNKIYVANLDSANVTVIDGASNKTTTVPAGTNPYAVAVNPATNKIYVANGGSANVTVIDGTSNKTTTVPAGTKPYAVAVNPATNKIYVANLDSDNVTVIDGASNTTTTVPAGISPNAVAVNSTSNEIYVANAGSANVTVIDGASNKTTSVDAGTSPYDVAVNPATNKIYVANYISNNVTVNEGASNKTTTVDAGTAPNAVAVNPANNKIYVTNGGSANVTVIDGASNETTTVPAGTGPGAVAVNPATNKIYVANLNSANVTVIDGASNTTTTVAAGTRPRAVAVNPATNKIYVANAGSANVTVIDGASNTTITVAVPTNLTATTASSSTISLAWTDKSSKETGFSIERKTGSGSYAEIAKLAANAVTYSDSGLSAGTAYTYRVKAIGNGGNIHDSSYSTEAEASTALGQTSNYRLSGQDRYKTAKAIAEEYNNAKCDGGVILASGNNFPDALSASVLSKKLNAPILLVDTTVGGSSEALNYTNAHVPLNSTIYFVGGTSVIGTDMEATLNATGYHNIKRLGGADRYDTNMLVVNETNVSKGTPVFIASGENFTDALSVSSFAGSKQYPTLLVGQNTLPEKTKNYIANNLPSSVYIAGGLSVISQDVENQIRAAVPNATVKRLAGNDRFDTTGAVVNEFSAAPQIVYLANGYNFPDALSGGALAAKTGNPILLIDHNITKLPPAIEAYLKKLHDAGNHPKVRALGGTVVVPDILLQQAETILDGKPFIILPPIKVIPLNP